MPVVDVWEKCDITVPKVDNNSVLTMDSRILSTQETYGIWERPCEQRKVNDILSETLCGLMYKGKIGQICFSRTVESPYLNSFSVSHSLLLGNLSKMLIRLHSTYCAVYEGDSR